MYSVTAFHEREAVAKKKKDNLTTDTTALIEFGHLFNYKILPAPFLTPVSLTLYALW